jgi:hypothetical protein
MQKFQSRMAVIYENGCTNSYVHVPLYIMYTCIYTYIYYIDTGVALERKVVSRLWRTPATAGSAVSL